MSNKIVVYKPKDEAIEFTIPLEGETGWLTQAQMAELFQVNQPIISKHIQHIFDDNEVDEESNILKWNISSTKPTIVYSLDVAIAVGFRIHSKRAIDFRIWANHVIKERIAELYTPPVTLSDHGIRAIIGSFGEAAVIAIESIINAIINEHRVESQEMLKTIAYLENKRAELDSEITFWHSKHDELERRLIKHIADSVNRWYETHVEDKVAEILDSAGFKRGVYYDFRVKVLNGRVRRGKLRNGQIDILTNNATIEVKRMVRLNDLIKNEGILDQVLGYNAVKKRKNVFIVTKNASKDRQELVDACATRGVTFLMFDDPDLLIKLVN